VKTLHLQYEESNTRQISIEKKTIENANLLVMLGDVFSDLEKAGIEVNGLHTEEIEVRTSTLISA
jgi:hypothetical protein